MRKFVVAAVCLLAPTLALAAAESETETGFRTVGRITSWHGGEFQVWLVDGEVDPAVCTQTYGNNRYVMRRDEVAEFDQKVSLLIAARLSGQKVGIQYACQNNVAVIRAVRL